MITNESYKPSIQITIKGLFSNKVIQQAKIPASCMNEQYLELWRYFLFFWTKVSHIGSVWDHPSSRRTLTGSQPYLLLFSTTIFPNVSSDDIPRLSLSIIHASVLHRSLDRFSSYFAGINSAAVTIQPKAFNHSKNSSKSPP